jgi:hypothetical protein
MAHKFSELIAKASEESRARADALYLKKVAEMEKMVWNRSEEVEEKYQEYMNCERDDSSTLEACYRCGRLLPLDRSVGFDGYGCVFCEDEEGLN